MAVANSGIQVTAGSGRTLATNKPMGSGTTEYQATVIANSTGQLLDSAPTYFLSIPGISGAAANVYPWEIFNGANSGLTVTVRGIWPIPDSARAVTGALSVGYQFYRTTALSSGGTNCTYESSSSLAANWARLNPADSALTSGVSCKTLVTSITTGSYLFSTFVFTEETNPASILQQYFNMIPDRFIGQELVIPKGQGLAVRAGPVASVGSVGWLIQVTTDP